MKKKSLIALDSPLYKKRLVREARNILRSMKTVYIPGTYDQKFNSGAMKIKWVRYCTITNTIVCTGYDNMERSGFEPLFDERGEEIVVSRQPYSADWYTS